jgi:hypothetical protein
MEDNNVLNPGLEAQEAVLRGIFGQKKDETTRNG